MIFDIWKIDVCIFQILRVFYIFVCEKNDPKKIFEFVFCVCDMWTNLLVLLILFPWWKADACLSFMFTILWFFVGILVEEFMTSILQIQIFYNLNDVYDGLLFVCLISKFLIIMFSDLRIFIFILLSMVSDSSSFHTSLIFWLFMKQNSSVFAFSGDSFRFFDWEILKNHQIFYDRIFLNFMIWVVCIFLFFESHWQGFFYDCFMIFLTFFDYGIFFFFIKFGNLKMEISFTISIDNLRFCSLYFWSFLFCFSCFLEVWISNSNWKILYFWKFDFCIL